MRAFVQASVKSRGFYWVTAEDNTEVEDTYPNYGFLDCMSLVDPALPSLVIAAMPTEENREGYKLALLILGLQVEAENAYINVPPTSLFLVFGPEEEAELRALAVALLSPATNQEEKHYSHNAQVSEQVNACIVKSFRLVSSNGREMREDFFTVSPEFFSTIEQIIKTKDDLVLKKDQAKLGADVGLVAKTSLSNRLALAAWLCENPLHLTGLPKNTRPLLVVTANKLPDKIVTAGAWRVMSNLVESETWRVLDTNKAASTIAASATDWVKKARSSHSTSTPPHVSQPVKQELEEAESANDDSKNENGSKSESDSAFQAAPTEREIPTLKEWGWQLATLLLLLPSVISNLIRGEPKKPKQDSNLS